MTSGEGCALRTAFFVSSRSRHTSSYGDWSSVVCSSDLTTIAKVSATGLVTARAAGLATVTATSEGKSGTSAVTVTAAPPPPTHPGWYVTPNGSSGETARASCRERDWLGAEGW